MTSKSDIAIQTRRSEPEKPEPSHLSPDYEMRIEARAKIISERIAALDNSAIPSLWGDAETSVQILERLEAQEARLRWLVRVAKYSEGANRTALWLEAGRVLAHLEGFLSMLARARCA